MVEEKLPKEITAKKLELQIYEDVINEKNINKQYLNNLQSQVNSSQMIDLGPLLKDMYLIFRLTK